MDNFDKFSNIFQLEMNSAQRTRKTKIELTQRSSQKYTSYRESTTPPKFRTNQTHHIQTEVSSRQSSRYQTLEHKPKPIALAIPQISRDSSVRKNPKNLHIDTDSINKHYEGRGAASQQKPVGATPLFANEDSTTILHRLHNKRKSENKVSYDHLIDAVKLNYENKEEQEPVQNMGNSYFRTSQNKVHDETFNTGDIKTFTSPLPHTSLIQSLNKNVDQLRKLIGNNPKLFQIQMLLSELQEEANANRYQISDIKHRCSQLQSNEIQNSLILKDYVHNVPQRWFVKQKHSTSKKENQNQRVRTVIDEKEREREWRQREREREREKGKNGLKTKSPLREIINYVNKKR